MISNRGAGGGSGVYLGRSLVVTCDHLFRDSRSGKQQTGRIIVSFSDGQASQAVVLKQDSEWDLAILRVEHPPHNLPSVEWATEMPKVGDQVISCGFGSGGKVCWNVGRIKGFGRSKNGSSGPADTMILSGQARGGDSGGPIFNAKGRICGVLWGSSNTEVVGTQVGRCLKFGGDWFRRPSSRPVESSPQATSPQRPPSNEKTTAEVARLSKQIASLHAELKSLKQLPGPRGPVGPQGPRGASHRFTTSELRELAVAVQKQMAGSIRMRVERID